LITEKFYFIVVFFLASLRAFCIGTGELRESFNSPVEQDGSYYASASIPLSSNSSMGKKIALKEAELAATKLIFNKFSSLIWSIPDELDSYKTLILAECNRKGTLFIQGLNVFSRKVIGNKAQVTVSVPLTSIPNQNERQKDAIAHLRDLAKNEKIFDILLIYELNLLNNEKDSLSLFAKKLSSVFEKNSMEVLLYRYSIEEIPLFYSAYDSEKWASQYKVFEKSEFLSAFEYGPYFNDLSYFAGKYFKSFGYSKMAELFFQRGSIFKFQSKYFTLCKNELGLKISEGDTNSEDCKSIIDFIIRANGNLPIINDSEINDDHLYGIKSFRAKDFNNSVDFFTSALGKNFNSETLNYLGRSLEEIGNQKHATIIFKQAVEINPDHEYAGTNLAFSLFKSGNLDEAIILKEKLLSKKNLNEWCINRLALIETDIPKKEVDERTLDFLESDMPEEGNKEDIPNFLDFIE